MQEDWRFKESPHVAIGGLRSYAGTQLRFRTNAGDDLALGSLCIASNAAHEPLVGAKKDALVHFAAMFSDDLINGARMNRHRARQHMSTLIADMQARGAPADMENFVIDTVKKVYPTSIITIQTSELIHVRGRRSVAFDTITDGLWEDTEYLDTLIAERNHEQLVAEQTVRAIVGRCEQPPMSRYLVVDSMNVQLVFDDIDTWFIERCAHILADVLQKRVLEHALKARETFLRSITHQLRTPVHGVLATSELLAEELTLRDTLIPSEIVYDAGYSSSRENATSMLSTITSSGRELMSTINNILKLNRWNDLGYSEEMRVEAYNFDNLETDLHDDITESSTISDYEHIFLFFDNRLPPGIVSSIDSDLLRECLTCLVHNALIFTTQGSVNIRFSIEGDSFQVDVIDTGCGIKEIDYTRIFEAYEKGDSNTRGAGLGLTLAAKLASKMRGVVELVLSEVGVGSHFRARFVLPDIHQQKDKISVAHEHLPKAYHSLSFSLKNPSFQPFADFLNHRGFIHAKSPEDAFLIIEHTDDVEAFRTLLHTTSPQQVILCLVAAGVSCTPLEQVARERSVIFCPGPFLTNRLDQLLLQANNTFQMLKTRPSLALTNKNSATGSDVVTPSLVAPTIITQIPTKKDPERFANSLPSVLVVDDNEINLHILRVFCEKRGMPHVMATDGHKATEAYQSAQDKAPINLILMDLQMPNCDGIQATEQIRALEAKAAVISNRKPSVIFMVTGQDSADDRHRSAMAGADEFYVKPVTIKMLDVAIKRYFKLFKPGQRNEEQKQGRPSSPVEPSSREGEQEKADERTEGNIGKKRDYSPVGARTTNRDLQTRDDLDQAIKMPG